MLLLALLIVSLSSFAVYFQERQAQVAPTITKLEVIADMKSKELQQWFQSLLGGIVKDLENEAIISDAVTLLKVRINIKPEYQQAYKRLKSRFSKLDPKRLNISILSNNGIVIFSTDKQQEGNYQPLQNTTTYFTLDAIQQVTPNLYESTLTRKPMITLAAPLNTVEGKRMGALAIDVNLEDLDRLIRHPVVSKSSTEQIKSQITESYIVGRISSVSNAFLTVANRSVTASNNNGLSNESVNSLGIDQAIQGQQGSGLYLNYNQIPVVGVYRWLPQYRLALLVEVAQSEVFAGATKLARQIFFGGVMGSLILIIILLWFGDRGNFLLQK
ncbi:unknown protein [Synechocystis sp. LKSZ1]